MYTNTNLLPKGVTDYVNLKLREYGLEAAEEMLFLNLNDIFINTKNLKDVREYLDYYVGLLSGKGENSKFKEPDKDGDLEPCDSCKHEGEISRFPGPCTGCCREGMYTGYESVEGFELQGEELENVEPCDSCKHESLISVFRGPCMGCCLEGDYMNHEPLESDNLAAF